MKIPPSISHRPVLGWLTLGLLGLIWPGPAPAQDLPDPRAYRENAMKASNLNTEGEQFTWFALGPAEELLRGYEATGDPRWLEEAVVYNDFLLSKLTKDPDGYEGWIGKNIMVATGRAAPEEFRSDALIGDANLLLPLTRFAVLVAADPSLNKRFGEQAKNYVALAERIGWEKWNKRGAYYRDAAGFGSYRSIQKNIDPKTNQWVSQDGTAKSENLNKHSGMAIVLLRLYALTGKEEYRTRAFEVFSRLKDMFRLFPEEKRVSWNFWMPHGPYDVKSPEERAAKPQDRPLKGWVAVHPKNPHYQAIEVGRIVEAYDYGLVFTQADLQLLIEANHYMMPKNPGDKWRSSDGTSDKGTLWSSLARFDPKIREETEKQLQAAAAKGKSRIALEYFENTTKKQLGWNRLYAKDPSKFRLSDKPVEPGRLLSATVVIPDRIETANDDKAQLITQTRGAGELKIELMDATGSRVLQELYKGRTSDREETILPEWDGTNPRSRRKDPGEYVVRWTLGKDVRTERVFVEVGQKREPARPSTAKPAVVEDPASEN